MNSERAKEIMSNFFGMNDKEKEEIFTGLEKIFNKRISFSETELATLNDKELETIKYVISGYILNRDETPNILEAYEKYINTPLPLTVSFGRILNDK